MNDEQKIAPILDAIVRRACAEESAQRLMALCLDLKDVGVVRASAWTNVPFDKDMQLKISVEAPAHEGRTISGREGVEVTVSTTCTLDALMLCRDQPNSVAIVDPDPFTSEHAAALKGTSTSVFLVFTSEAKALKWRMQCGALAKEMSHESNGDVDITGVTASVIEIDLAKFLA